MSRLVFSVCPDREFENQCPDSSSSIVGRPWLRYGNLEKMMYIYAGGNLDFLQNKGKISLVYYGKILRGNDRGIRKADKERKK